MAIYQLRNKATPVGSSISCWGHVQLFIATSAWSQAPIVRSGRKDLVKTNDRQSESHASTHLALYPLALKYAPALIFQTLYFRIVGKQKK